MVSMNSFELLPPHSLPEENVQIEEVNIEDDIGVGIQELPLPVINNLQENADQSINQKILEMYDCVRVLFDENVVLKEKLRISNIAIKEQLDQINTWGRQIDETVEKHKSEMEKLLKVNQTLQEEKDDLVKKIKDIEEASSSSQSCSTCDEVTKKCVDLEAQILLLKSEVTNQELLKSDSSIEEITPRNDYLLTTLTAEDENDFSIIVKEDFMSLKPGDMEQLKNLQQHCGKLEKQLSIMAYELADERIKSENFGKILAEKESDLQNLRSKQEEQTLRNAENLSIISHHDEENKKILITLQETQEKLITVTQELDSKNAELKVEHVLLDQREFELKAIKEEHEALLQHLSVISVVIDEKAVLSSTVDDLKAKIENFKSELDEKDEKLKGLQLLLDEKEMELNKFHTEYDTMMQSMCVLSLMDQDNKNLSSTIENLETQVKELKSELEEKKLKFQTVEKDIAGKTTELEEMQKQYSDLMALKENYLSQISQLEEDQTMYKDQVKDLQVLQEKYEDLQNQEKTVKGKLNASRISNCEKVTAIQKLQKNLDDKNEELKTSREKCAVLGMHLHASEQNFNILSKDHDNLIKAYSDRREQGAAQSQGCSVESRSSLSAIERANYQNEMDALTAQLLKSEDDLAEQQNRCEQMKRQIQTLNEESRHIPQLNAQVDILQDDLNSEKIARNDAEIKYVRSQQENESLKQQLKELRESLVIRHGRRHHRPSRRSSDDNTANQTTEDASAISNPNSSLTVEYECPICPLRFASTRAIENHVEECLMKRQYQ